MQMPEKTWSAAIRELMDAAARHKLASGIAAGCAALSLAAIAWAGTSSPATAAEPDPVAHAFSLPLLTRSGPAAARVSLSTYAGKPLIVNFFASWCPPCQGETPLLARFYRGEHGKVALVGLDENDTVGAAVKFITADKVGYPVAWDPGLSMVADYGVDGLPQTFFLNAQHQIVDHIVGPVNNADLAKGVALATRKAAK
jgi:cytochrome c biogenesis protein CcmG, thiol:disulfide interchange protein DsbE